MLQSILGLGAAMMYLLEPSKQFEAISIATSLEDINERTIEVSLRYVVSFVAFIFFMFRFMFRHIVTVLSYKLKLSIRPYA